MITISQELFNTIILHLKDKLPNEGCGYLGGLEDSILMFEPMTNILSSAKEFAFDPAEQFTAVRTFREKGYKIIGVVHSHPAGKASPSERDIELADPNLYQLIVIPKNGDYALFSISQDSVTPIAMTIE